MLTITMIVGVCFYAVGVAVGRNWDELTKED